MTEELFSPEQKKMLQQMIREEVDLAVLASAGDSVRSLRVLDLMRQEVELGSFSELPKRTRLIEITKIASNQANAEYGISPKYDD